VLCPDRRPNVGFAGHLPTDVSSQERVGQVWPDDVAQEALESTDGLSLAECTIIFRSCDPIGDTYGKQFQTMTSLGKERLHLDRAIDCRLPCSICSSAICYECSRWEPTLWILSLSLLSLDLVATKLVSP
jgi:hypothetical protein